MIEFPMKSSPTLYSAPSTLTLLDDGETQSQIELRIYPGNTLGYPGNTLGYPGNTSGYPGNTSGYPRNTSGYPRNTSAYPGKGPWFI